MIKLLRSFVIVRLLGLAVVQVQADQTNAVQTLSIELYGLRQGRTVTNRETVSTSVEVARISTADVIEALGAATGNTFSRAARLVNVTPLNGGSSRVQVRDGDSALDVSGFFTQGPISGSVESSVANTRGRRYAGTDYSIERFALHDSGGFAALAIHFDVQGVARHSTSTSPSAGSQSEMDAEVAGAGDRNGGLLILRGAARLRGLKLEVVPTGPAPGV